MFSVMCLLLLNVNKMLIITEHTTQATLLLPRAIIPLSLCVPAFHTKYTFGSKCVYRLGRPFRFFPLLLLHLIEHIGR